MMPHRALAPGPGCAGLARCPSQRVSCPEWGCCLLIVAIRSLTVDVTADTASARWVSPRTHWRGRPPPGRGRAYGGFGGLARGWAPGASPIDRLTALPRANDEP